MGLKTYFKRGIKYILKGQPQYIIKAEIMQKTPQDIFNNKTIMITGGGSGLGFYIAKKCISEGAYVIILGRNEEKLKQAAKKLGDKCSYIIFDIQDVDKVNEIIDDVFEKFNGIDCLINNAGISLHETSFQNVTPNGFDEQFNINLRGAYFLTQAYLNKLEKCNKKKGNVIFISSERGAQCDDIPYGLTKIAINSLTEALSRRYYKRGIRVNAVAPGITASDMTNIKKEDNLFCDYNASGRFFVPEEVAEVVAFLVSDYSNCISGEVIYCDGGNHLNPWFEN